MPSEANIPTQQSLTNLFQGFEYSADPPEDLPPGAELRTSPRRTLSVPMWVRLLPSNGNDPVQARQLHDISDNGLGLISRHPFPQNKLMLVELCINNKTWSGGMRIAHCTPVIGSYRVGLEMSERQFSTALPPQNHQSGFRRPDFENFQDLQAEIPKAMRAYRQARISWGLLGTPLKAKLLRLIADLPGTQDENPDDCQRKHQRLVMTGDVHMVVPTYYGGRWLRVQIVDVSEGGAGLSLPTNPSTGMVERELAGDFRIAPKMPVIIGIGTDPDIVWIPSEITYCGKPQNGAMRLGVQFNTQLAQKAFGA